MMNRCLALIFAVLCASLTVASACTAAPGEWIYFTLDPERSGDRIHATFRDDEGGRRNNNWSTGFAPQQLTGLDVAGFRAAGARPLSFALVREAGRLDCSGQGGSSTAAGRCAFTPDAGFLQLLDRRGIGRPTRQEAFGLMAVDVRRATIEAIAGAGYPTPGIDDLMALAALDVSARYISDLARLGFRPKSIDDLVEFKALNISPDDIAGFARAGYGNLEADDLVQLKALNITPAYVAEFNRLGYRNLPVATLVQLKALDISPDFVRSAESRRGQMPPVDELVQRKIFGRPR
jgi:hypothetical protein